jgi:ribosomal protein S18 acetylase RimI-like enzyme
VSRAKTALPVEIVETDPANIPRDLLLSADPSPEMVDSYLYRGRWFAAVLDGAMIGELVIVVTRPLTWEIMNVAVAEAWQRRGVATRLISHVLRLARDAKVRTVEIGTGAPGATQLILYQRLGFRVIGVDRDFFVRHYPEPIYENGIWCRDMLRLERRMDEDHLPGAL